MGQRSGGRRRRLLLLLFACTCSWVGTSSADDGDAPPLPLGGGSRDLLRAARTYRVGRARALALTQFVAPGAARPLLPHAQLDVSPVLDEIFGFFHHHGVPLEEQRDEQGRGPIGVYADFSVGRNLPAVSFHLGDRPIEPLGAFYSAERGFRCALVWPVDRFTLRLEGGEDSEFGYFGIAGVQWIHPTRPIAAGIGVPMNLRDANGDIGVIFQFRMTLD